MSFLYMKEKRVREGSREEEKKEKKEGERENKKGTGGNDRNHDSFSNPPSLQ